VLLHSVAFALILPSLLPMYVPLQLDCPPP
jgi:hypothetical protein